MKREVFIDYAEVKAQNLKLPTEILQIAKPLS
jgi:hypothetical protein